MKFLLATLLVLASSHTAQADTLGVHWTDANGPDVTFELCLYDGVSSDCNFGKYDVVILSTEEDGSFLSEVKTDDPLPQVDVHSVMVTRNAGGRKSENSNVRTYLIPDAPVLLEGGLNVSVSVEVEINGRLVANE